MNYVGWTDFVMNWHSMVVFWCLSKVNGPSSSTTRNRFHVIYWNANRISAAIVGRLLQPIFAFRHLVP